MTYSELKTLIKEGKKEYNKNGESILFHRIDNLLINYGFIEGVLILSKKNERELADLFADVMNSSKGKVSTYNTSAPARTSGYAGSTKKQKGPFINVAKIRKSGNRGERE